MATVGRSKCGGGHAWLLLGARRRAAVSHRAAVATAQTAGPAQRLAVSQNVDSTPPWTVTECVRTGLDVVRIGGALKMQDLTLTDLLFSHPLFARHRNDAQLRSIKS